MEIESDVCEFLNPVMVNRFEMVYRRYFHNRDRDYAMRISVSTLSQALLLLLNRNILLFR